jgi:hypothetical protein
MVLDDDIIRQLGGAATARAVHEADASFPCLLHRLGDRHA